MSQIFMKILNMSMTASYCIVVVMTLRFFFKKQPKILSYLLWSVVLFRLVCPFSITGSFSLMRLDTNMMSQENMMRWSDTESDSTPRIAEAESNTAQKETDETVTVEPRHADISNKVSNKGEIISIQNVVDAAAWIWFGGVILLICYSVGKAVSLAHLLKGAVRIEENQYESERIETPFVFGLVRPRIYLPAHLQDEDKKYVLEHENIHIARKDYFIKAVAYAAVCVHWCNPLVWLAFSFMEKDMEMSCDEAVLKRMGLDVKKDYSMSLLSLSAQKTIFWNNSLAFGEGKVKDRIQNILSYRKRTFLAVLAAAVIFLSVGAGLIINPAEQTGAERKDAEQTGTEQTDAEQADVEQIGTEQANAEQISAEQISDADREKITALVEKYANACCAKDGAAIVALYTDEETALINEERRSLKKDGDGYTLEPSPWTRMGAYRYAVSWEEGKADIRYYTRSLEPHVVVWRAEIEYVKTGDEYRISACDLDMLYLITSAEKFEKAYLVGGEYQFVDFAKDGYLEELKYERKRKENISSVDYTVYETPERAAEYILNLTGGESIVEGDYTSQALVRYQFADGSEVMIPMYDANYDPQGDAKQGEPLWVVDTAVWNAGAL